MGGSMTSLMRTPSITAMSPTNQHLQHGAGGGMHGATPGTTPFILVSSPQNAGAGGMSIQMISIMHSASSPQMQAIQNRLDSIAETGANFTPPGDAQAGEVRFGADMCRAFEERACM